MAFFRGISEWENRNAYIQRDGDRIFTTNKSILVMNDRSILKCMTRAGIGMEDLEDGLVYLFGFKSGSRGYRGFCLEDQWMHSSGTLSRYFNRLEAGGIEVTEGEVPNCFSGDKDLFVSLVCDGGEGFLVNRRYHDYVLDVTGADKMLAAFPVICTLKGDVVGAVAQFNFFFDREKKRCEMKECLESMYDARKYCWNSLKD